MPDARPIRVHADAIEMVAIADITSYEGNVREHPRQQIDALKAVIVEHGFTQPLTINEANVVLGGHGRVLAAEELGMIEVPCIRVRGLTPPQERALRLSDNQLALLSTWNIPGLRIELEALRVEGIALDLTGFTALDLSSIGIGAPPGDGGGASDGGAGSLAEKFGVVPFSVLNAREGWWQERKRAWISLGIKSELGRGENLIERSIFDVAAAALSGTYGETKEWIEGLRANGLTEDEIKAEISRAHHTKGRGISGAQRMRGEGGGHDS